jgi:pyruvate formate-lyase activating enzyme-like uncharacterized protein
MKLISVQEAFRRKLERQARIPTLEYHASGHCIHIGRLSPGCHHCFVPDTFSYNVHMGHECNADCPYCFGTKHEIIQKENLLTIKGHLLHKALNADLRGIIPSISFSGGTGDPLLRPDLVEYFMTFYRGIEPNLSKRPWYYLYTNGILADSTMILRLKEHGFDEVRFHLGASNFSPHVYDHMAEAAQHIPVITVETPAWPLHRDQLFEMLPKLQQIGVKHLNIGEVQITYENRERIEALLPEAEIYQNGLINLDDGGLVYELMAEVIKQDYSYSVLDCNSLVKGIQTSPGKWIMCEPVDDLCTGYNG